MSSEGGKQYRFEYHFDDDGKIVLKEVETFNE